MPTNKRTRNPFAGRTVAQRGLVTEEFRDTIRKLLDKNQHRIAIWLEAVAEGNPAFNISPDPARALDLLTKLAEFAAPKLNRVEHSGEVNGLQPATLIEIEFVHTKAPAYLLNGHGSDAGQAPTDTP